MSDKEKRNISDTIKILMQLDKQSLLLIDSGARLLAARLERHERQPMDYERYKFTLYFVAGMVAMVLGFVAAFMIIYFAGT